MNRWGVFPKAVPPVANPSGAKSSGERETNLRLVTPVTPSKRITLFQNVWNALGYNLFWWIGVSSAASGDVWTGPVAMLTFVAIALRWTPWAQRAAELRFLAAATCLGWTLDSGLFQLGAIVYPTSELAWSWPIAPPWIAALWLGFATMPRFSLGWLKRQPTWLTVGFGAVGGPLAFFAGTRLGAIEAGMGLATYALLAIEYGVVTWGFIQVHARIQKRRMGRHTPAN